MEFDPAALWLFVGALTSAARKNCHHGSDTTFGYPIPPSTGP
jgi:hypothetical protein